MESNSLNPAIALWMTRHSQQLDFVRNPSSKYSDSIGRLNKESWKAYGKYVSNYSQTSGGSFAAIMRHPSNGPSASTQPYNSLITTYNNYTTQTGPLLNDIQWNQNSPYNQYCPLGTGNFVTNGHDPAGCVPVAMAQIMAYWQYPAAYSWNNMAHYIDNEVINNVPIEPLADPDIHPERFTSTALLLYQIGSTPALNQISLVSYSGDNSGADMGNVPFVFNIFGYTGISFAGYSNTAQSPIWSGPANNSNNSLIVNEITNNRPCIVAGFPGENSFLGIYYSATGNGHAWVCDGVQYTYSQPVYTFTYYTQTSWGWQPNTTITYGSYSIISTLIHCNYGLAMGSNGFYDYTHYTIVPDDTSDNDKYFQQVIYNIKH